jgi:hypothetical protein
MKKTKNKAVPEFVKKKRIGRKICLECGKHYIGHIISKYCPKHRKPSERKMKEVIPQENQNIVFKHASKEMTNHEFVCQLTGCSKTYIIKLIPHQFIYPKYCPEHRNEFKRKLFLSKHS